MKEINEILDIFENGHIDFNIKRNKEEINQYINSYSESNEIKNNYDIIFFIKCLLKFCFEEFDSHTRIRFKQPNKMPLKFKIINSRVYVVDAISQIESLKYMELTKVNDIDIKELFKIIEKGTCYSTEGHLEQEIETYLNTNQIKILPVIKDKRDIKFELRSENEIHLIKLGLDEDYKTGFDEKFINENLKCRVENEKLIVCYNDCNLPKEENEKMVRLVENIKEKLSNCKIDKIIIDFRGNTGGSALTFLPLLRVFKKLKSDYKFYCFIDKYNFSAVRFNILDCKNMLDATLVGTEIGTRLNCFGQCEHAEYTMEGIEKLDITFSKRYFYIDNSRNFNACLTKEEVENLYRTERNKFDKGIYIFPGIMIQDDINSYKSKIDNYESKI